ncbi:Dabb family protein [Catalinimonas niigatensis]|uniref:Dabb family protein n=1 Tax=Catalinimonas niigatensis TaxID=1397264 RepID=UPI00266556FB|nr:Dabb family protein [Catalinimonas niigatensis]WPP52722.1 Dabb family protein [Catalinimonas niigatensis]
MKSYVITIGLLVLIACQPQEQDNQVDETIQSEVNPKVTPAMSEDQPPIQRIVAFKFKEDVSQEAIQQHMDYFAALKDSIPQILSYRAGQTFPADYEGTGDYDVLHYATFESEESIEEYFNHPAHQRFIAANKDIWANVIVLNSSVED